MEKCVLCGCELEGYGNNPYPLATEGRCCDSCDMQVIAARIKQVREAKIDNLIKTISNKITKEIRDANAESGVEGVREVLAKYDLLDVLERKGEE
jgi:hypothetical protein